jgi:hypothetical protein
LDRAPRTRFLRDRDGTCASAFDEIFRSERIGVIRTPVRAPRANGYAERYVRRVRNECLEPRCPNRERINANETQTPTWPPASTLGSCPVEPATRGRCSVSSTLLAVGPRGKNGKDRRSFVFAQASVGRRIPLNDAPDRTPPN